MTSNDKKKTVFLIQGRNHDANLALSTFLRSIGLNPLEWLQIVAEMEEGSPYVGDVLEKGFSISQAAVSLMTPDYEAQLSISLRNENDEYWETQLTPQPRQNVLFETGMAMGRFPKRTVIVELGKLRPFTDVIGRHVVRWDNTTAKRQELAIKLESAGCIVNLKGTQWHTAGQYEPSLTKQDKTQDVQSVESKTDETVPKNLFHTLAEDCEITEDELKDVLSVKGDKIEIHASITGTDTKRQVIASQCILIAYSTIFDQEWTRASLLTDGLSEMGIQNLGNLASNLKKQSKIFRKRGGGKGTEYKLTTSDGRKSARRIIHKLAKGESLDEN